MLISLLLLWQFHITPPPGMKLSVTIDGQPPVTADTVAIFLVTIPGGSGCHCASGLSGNACAGPGMLLTGDCVQVQEFEGLLQVLRDIPTPVSCDDMVAYTDPALQSQVHIDPALRAQRVATGTCAP